MQFPPAESRVGGKILTSPVEWVDLRNMVHPGLICIAIVEAIPGQEANRELAESSLAKAFLRHVKICQGRQSTRKTCQPPCLQSCWILPFPLWRRQHSLRYFRSHLMSNPWGARDPTWFHNDLNIWRKAARFGLFLRAALAGVPQRTMDCIYTKVEKMSKSILK